MTLMRTTGRFNRYSLHLGLGGVAARHSRTKVGGGWYIKHEVYVPYPWNRRGLG